MDGVGGLAGWRWIYIIEGLMTIVLSVAGYIFIDFPDKVYLASWKYIAPEEVQIFQVRIKADHGNTEYDPVTLEKTIRTLGK